MTNVKKTLEMTGLLFGLVTLFCYIGWHLGYDGLILVGNVTISKIPLYLIEFALFSINFTLITSFSINEYSWKVIKFITPYLVLDFVVELFYPGIMMSGPVMLVYLSFLGLIRKDFKRTLIRSIISSLLIIVYQFFAIFTKTGELSFSYMLPIYTILMMSIDMVIFSLLIWTIGGVKESDKRNQKLESLVFPGRVRDDRNRNEDNIPLLQNQESLIPLGRFEQWVMRSVIAAVQVLQWMLILWVCNLDNLFLDGLVITTSFICHGMIIQKRKHLKPIILCTLVATMMFYFAARFTISFRYSQFFPIIVGLVLIYTVYRISYQFEKAAQEKTQKDLERIRALEIQMSEAWKQIDNLS